MHYIVGFCQSNEFLNCQRVVGVFIWMLEQRHLAVLFTDLLLVGHNVQIQDLVRIERLQALNAADHLVVYHP